MRKVHPAMFLASLLSVFFAFSCERGPKFDYPLKPVAWSKVVFKDTFWAPRLETNRTVTIPHILEQCKETGRIRNFELAAIALDEARDGKFCSKYPFDDSDVYKALEAAAFALSTERDPEMEREIDEIISKIAAAQEGDGYLYSARTIGGPPPVDWMGEERWSNLTLSHELYNAGHLYEAAVAYYQATGKRTLLDVAVKHAELIDKEFGPGRRMNPPGHQEIEIGLVKLFRLTGKKKYLDLAKFFLDVRGDAEGHKLYGEYSQDHKPVWQQAEAVGHAVRAGYMYTSMADVAALTSDQALIAALSKIWDDVIGTKIYLTGGIGAAGDWEGYGPAHDLPNDRAYAETCAAIATFLWNGRMFLLNRDGQYVDVMERILYNGLLSGLSLSGNLFFYENPLASSGQHERKPWFNCACCPPNIARILASLPGHVYATAEDKIYVNLYIQNEGKVRVGNSEIELIQSTDYPWNGHIKIEVNPQKEAFFSLFLRIPGWSVGRPIPSNLYRYTSLDAETPAIKVNGEAIALNIEQGYVDIRRTWKSGDRIEINLPMPVRRVVAHEEVEADRGLVAVERGPLVYCAEWPGSEGGIGHFVVPDEIVLEPEFQPDLLMGIVTISGEAQVVSNQDGIYTAAKKTLTLIPYYAWANRGRSEMSVWLSRKVNKASPGS